MDEKAIKNFIKQKPCIPATKGVRLASIGSIILFLPMGLLLIIAAVAFGINDRITVHYYALGTIFVISTVAPTILQKHYANKINSQDNVASTYWLIGTLVSYITGANAIITATALVLNEKLTTLIIMVIVAVLSAFATFFLAIYWCKRRIMHQNGSLELKTVFKHPVVAAAIVMTSISGASAGGRVALAALVLVLINGILFTGLAQTILKLKYAKELSAEECLPKYRL